MKLLERIKELSNFHGIDFIGVAGISHIENEIKDIGGSVTSGFPKGTVHWNSIAKKYCRSFE